MTTAIAESLDDGINALMSIVDAAFSRWPVVRYGPRGHIPFETQRLVFARDNYRCKICGDFEGRRAIDHIRPWSAGGSDTSENLRVLCEFCNNVRSNRKEVYYPRVLPCTPACTPCWLEQYPDREVTDWRAPAWCGYCETTSWVDSPEALR